MMGLMDLPLLDSVILSITIVKLIETLVHNRELQGKLRMKKKIKGDKEGKGKEESTVVNILNIGIPNIKSHNYILQLLFGRIAEQFIHQTRLFCLLAFIFFFFSLEMQDFWDTILYTIETFTNASCFLDLLAKRYLFL
jgi:hypothetical protein